MSTPGPLEDDVAQAQFQRLIDAEEMNEPRDWMPDKCLKSQIRQISQHAHSEIIGMQPKGNLDNPGPPPGIAPWCCSPRCKMHLVTGCISTASAVTLRRYTRGAWCRRPCTMAKLNTLPSSITQRPPGLMSHQVGCIFGRRPVVVNQISLQRSSYGP